MQALKRIATKTEFQRLSSTITKTHFISSTNFRPFSSNSKKGDDDWNDAWETAWLPPDLSGSSSRAPWEADVNFSSSESSVVLSSDADLETKAFVEDMNENWNERRKPKEEKQQSENGSSLYSLDSIKKDYRIKKQRIHAGLWMKEIEKQEEAKLADSNSFGGGDDIERLLDSCSDIFDSANNDLENSKAPTASDFKNKPDGWETTSKAKDGNVWEMTQREEDILLQEFERRIAYNKFQIASFIKTHIFSRRRPIDGWKYMIEELGPNARKGKGSVTRLPSLSDASTQPFKEENSAMSGSSIMPFKERKIEDAHKLFDEFPQGNDLISWNTLMGYLHVSQPQGDLGSYLGGESLQGYCINIGFCLYLQVLTALIDMYAKNGQIDFGHRIFDGVAVKDVVLWNCLVDRTAFGAASGSLSVGSCIKDYVGEENLVMDAVLGTALVDMYAKCVFLEKALDIFESMESKDVKSWTAMISGYGVHGQAGNAIRPFYTMEEEGCQPNEVTFLTVLSACSHGEMVTEGVRCFEIMVCKYGFVPKVEHHGCMVDILGCAGLLEEAHTLID
ncbi:Hypothetical predicted protein [Prunus dulcis]|uniref:Pentatricopeptide repeat superfamily protein n=2 Tax=Prunus dulcis TaxID=3755 RepID=A0A5E4FSG5_PRUDU|nr:Hypothetical predicted protein [Prunus dulcis]